jgi:hypothetical protein
MHSFAKSLARSSLIPNLLRLTSAAFPNKVALGPAQQHGRSVCCAVLLSWEVVQSAVHQPLELTILVRVQASQPIFSR